NALYGIGGIGKTQAALKYVYTNKNTYKRIYWVSAVDQASLLAGYYSIARGAQLKFPSGDSSKIAEFVLRWLQHQDSWLIVIDNLDDISVIKSLLPSNTGPLQHTLITTRNPNSQGIPAQGIEVPLFDSEEAIELLSTLSDLEIVPNSLERELAERIVNELGNLPL